MFVAPGLSPRIVINKLVYLFVAWQCVKHPRPGNGTRHGRGGAQGKMTVNRKGELRDCDNGNARKMTARDATLARISRRRVINKTFAAGVQQTI